MVILYETTNKYLQNFNTTNLGGRLKNKFKHVSYVR